MTLSFESLSGQNENVDPFVVTPPRKHSPNKQIHPTTPATPKSSSTPLHKRFLEEVRMSPGTPTTPPRTPSKCPNRSQTPVKQTLEVGQNGFYFSMEIPVKKPSPRSMGRVTPSPQKEKNKTKSGGRVRDILRKNLFGTPTKNANSPRKGDSQDEVKMSPPKHSGHRTALALGSRTNDGSGRRSSGSEESLLSVLPENVPDDTARKAATRLPDAPAAQVPSQASAPPLQQSAQPTMDSSAPGKQTPKVPSSSPAKTSITPAAPILDLRKCSTTSTPSNIGHLMAGLSNKSSKVQMLPAGGSAESMPTPLRKMSERLGLNSPHFTRKDIINEMSPVTSAMMLKSERLKSQISALDLRNTATTENGPAPASPPSPADGSSALPKDVNTMSEENVLAQLLGSHSAVTSPVVYSRTSTATTAPSAAPTTPPRPDAPSRSQSFGTPPRLRSSIQEDMCKVQESLKRSLGPESSLQSPNRTRPTTSMPPTAPMANTDMSATKHTKNSIKSVTRPISMIGPAKSNGVSSTQAVPRRPLNTATRKPRPKSMFVGSTKLPETITSHVDSPRVQVKLCSSGATPSGNETRPSSSRPGTAASASRRPVAAITTLSPSKPQPKVRTTNSAALRAAAHPKRPVAPAPAVNPQPQGQRLVSAEAIAERIAEWKQEDRKNAASKALVRAKPTKSPSRPGSKPANKRAVKAPEPRDTKADSGLGRSYTPPGNPTHLPTPVKSPPKIRLAVPIKPGPKKAAIASKAAKLRTPLPTKTPVNRRISLRDPNAIRTPSKEIQSSLDRAIDAKIAEDARSGKEFTPSGNRISELLEAKS